jgi:predicted RNase H-like HicB family nuclease
MERYRAVAYPSGNWWAIEVPDHPGLFSQAKQLEAVAPMAADALSLWLEREVTPAQIDVETRSSGLEPVAR